MRKSVPAPDKALCSDLVTANRILYKKQVVDGLGHVSFRHNVDPNLYVLAAEKAPALVTESDLAIYDLDSNALTLKDRRPYNERFIHGEVYKARPDINAIIHCHTPALVTFCVCHVQLRPLYHMSGFLCRGVGRFEIRDVAGDDTDMMVTNQTLGAALAKAMGDTQLVLMRGHGATIAADTIRQAVHRAVYGAENAVMQMNAIRMGEVTYLNEKEAQRGMEKCDRFVDRWWELWKLEADQ